MNEKVKLSVIITTYNRLSFLKQAVQSVLDQNYDNYELIIIDDCSTDGTEDWINAVKSNKNLYYIRNSENKGVGFNRKLAYSKSNGKYVIFMDDDDYYIDKNFFYNGINVFENNTEQKISFVSGNAYILFNDINQMQEQKIKLRGYVDNVEYLINFQDTYSKPFSTFTTIFNKSYLEKANFKKMKIVNDSSIYMRALLTGGAYILDENIGVYRIHSSNISKSLKSDFIIENLYEKKSILEDMKKNYIKTNYLNWWFRQLSITLNYYIQGSKPSIKEIFKILLWSYKNTEKNKWKVIVIFIRIYVNINKNMENKNGR